MFLAQNLEYLREEKGMSQNEMAKFLDIRQPTIWNWESGRRQPELDMLVRIAKYFGVTLDDLVLKDLKPSVSLYISNIKYLRRKSGITQEDMAAFLGYSGKSSICAVETGKASLTIEKLEKLADFFDITLDQLVRQDLSKVSD